MHASRCCFTSVQQRLLSRDLPIWARVTRYDVVSASGFGSCCYIVLMDRPVVWSSSHPSPYLDNMTLPPKYQIPPMPPIVHRRISLARSEDGLVVFARGEDRSEGALLKWGVKGGLSRWSGDIDEAVELGGILGIVRLWDSEWSNLACEGVRSVEMHTS